jgi:electron transport complex protein RnfC
MILNFRGGVRPDHRTIYAKQKIKYINDMAALCIEARDDARAAIKAGDAVYKGTLIGHSDDTPVYSPVSGIFRGVGTISDGRYFVIISDGKGIESAPFEPETRPLDSLTHDDITEAAKKFAIYDSRSGLPLWKLLENAKKFKRVVIDCTESDPKSAISYRICIEKAKSVVGGAKILVRATDALKCVFAIEHYRNVPVSALAEYAHDERLFAAAPLAEKYPYTDSALMYALYIKTLKKGETPLDHGVLIVSAETAAALYDAMVSGMPQTGRYIGICGEDLASGGNVYIPRGATIRDISALFAPSDKDSVTVENSLLSGKRVVGAINDSTRTIITVKPKTKPRALCVSCGKCIEVCPVGLVPRDILSSNNNTLSKYCTRCGACEFVCPSGIPLARLINKSAETAKNKTTEVE